MWMLKEERMARRFFYWKERFKEVDLKFSEIFSFLNPYRISRKYLQAKGAKDIHVYGETPLTTLRLIAEECGIKSSDYVIEMGCGRGRSCFFLSEYLGCKVHGIERIGKFVESAMKVAKETLCHNISFSNEDMAESDLGAASVIYLYGSSLSDEEIAILIKKFEQLSPSTKIITVSYPLSDYSKKFITSKKFSASFPWGDAIVYLNNSC